MSSQNSRRTPHRPGRVALALAGLAWITGTAAARAQVGCGPFVGVPAGTVPVTDPATGLVDQLLALVPVRGGIVGQRPYAVREVARLAVAASAELARRDSVRLAAWRRSGPPTGSLPPAAPPAEVRAAALAAALRCHYGHVLGGGSDTPGGAVLPNVTLRPFDFAWAHVVASGERPRDVPDSNGIGIGRIDARTLPALDLRYGRPAVQGAVGSIETAHAFGVGGWLAAVAQPRASVVAERLPNGDVRSRLNVEPQRLFARAVVRNAAVQAGIDEWAWGQGGAGGMFLSAAARPLRAVSVQADTAFALPGFLRGAGRWRAALAVADLGRGQNFPHAKLAAYKVSLAPSPFVELGGGVMSQFGGRGAPPLTLAQRAADLFPYVFWLDKGSDLQRSNKIASFDVRVRVPRWAGFTAAWEATPDDMDLRRFWGVLRDDTGHLLDLRWARLRADGGLTLGLTAQRTGIRQYEHATFVSGVTYRGGVLGAPVGPHATAFGGTLTWRPRPLDAVALTVTREARDPSLYRTAFDGADAQNFRFVLVERRPVERRVRVAVEAERAQPGPGRSLTARVGAERAGNYAFQAGTTLARPFGELGVRVRF